jgi:hypothetical protein
MQSVRHIISYGGVFQAATTLNVSFGKGLLMVPDGIKAGNNGGTVPDGYLAGPRSLIGYAILVLVVVSLLALGRRILPVMVGIVLLATAALFPVVSLPYYLVFALPVAALVARDPDGPPGTGIFDRFTTAGEPRRVVGICVSLAAALSIVHIALPSPSVPAEIAGPVQAGVSAIVQTRALVVTTASLTPLLWLVACGAIIITMTKCRLGRLPRLLSALHPHPRNRPSPHRSGRRNPGNSVDREDLGSTARRGQIDRRCCRPIR